MYFAFLLPAWSAIPDSPYSFMHARCGLSVCGARLSIKSRQAVSTVVFLHLHARSICVQYTIPSHRILSGLELPVSPSMSNP